MIVLLGMLILMTTFLLSAYISTTRRTSFTVAVISHLTNRGEKVPI
jgi:hypothetical protein